MLYPVTCYGDLIINSTAALFLSPEWLMQHIHSQGMSTEMLKKMWVYIVGRCFFPLFKNLLFPLVKQSCIVFYSVCPSLNLFPRCRWAPGLANWRVQSRSWRRKQGRRGSEEVCGRRGLSGSGLSVVYQEVNYVSVGGSLCHRLCCLSILGKKRREDVPASHGRHCSGLS